MRKMRSVFFAALAALLVAVPASGRGRRAAYVPGARPVAAVSSATNTAHVVARDGWYYDRDRVVAYLRTYGRLPGNFITKAQARQLGWRGGPLEPYAPGKAIGGDRFGNYERRLPAGRWQECDIDTQGRARGAKRLIFSADRRYYYTTDHYQTFERVP